MSIRHQLDVAYKQVCLYLIEMKMLSKDQLQAMMSHQEMTTESLTGIIEKYGWLQAYKDELEGKVDDTRGLEAYCKDCHRNLLTQALLLAKQPDSILSVANYMPSVASTRLMIQQCLRYKTNIDYTKFAALMRVPCKIIYAATK